VTASDLRALLDREAAEDAERARDGDSEAGERLFDSLLRAALEALEKRLRFDPVEPSDALALLGLDRRGKPGRIPKAARAEAAARLRAVVEMARRSGAPGPLLTFYSTAADAIEAGAEPLRALGLKRRRGRPRDEGELTRFARDFLTDAAFVAARARGIRREPALEAAGAELGNLTGRGRSEESARRARRRLKRNPPNS